MPSSRMRSFRRRVENGLDGEKNGENGGAVTPVNETAEGKKRVRAREREGGIYICVCVCVCNGGNTFK